MTLAYITCKDKKQAESITKRLLNKKLIACANIFPISSIYAWKGKIVNEKEYVLVAKTNEKKFKAVVKETTKIHTYEIPCILKIKEEANKPYAAWVEKELS